MSFKLDDRPIRSAEELEERLTAATEQVQRASAREKPAQGMNVDGVRSAKTRARKVTGAESSGVDEQSTRRGRRSPSG
jgi:hypothetical protein